MRSLQLILQDLRPSENHAKAGRFAQERLDEILGGAPIYPEENLVPNRDEIASVFTVLRTDARMGNRTVSERSLLDRVNRGGLAKDPITPLKLRLISMILTEMAVCRIGDPIDGIYVFDIDFNAPKTSIDASSLLQRLRRQLTVG